VNGRRAQTRRPFTLAGEAPMNPGTPEAAFRNSIPYGGPLFINRGRMPEFMLLTAPS
jgi:hypothetical protein